MYLAIFKTCPADILDSIALKSNKNVITATLASAFIAKALTKGFASGTLAKLGPIRIKA